MEKVHYRRGLVDQSVSSESGQYGLVWSDLV